LWSLAIAIDCDPSNITGLVDKLEMKSYIRRRPDPNDRRVKMIAVIEAGWKVRAQLLARLSEPPPVRSTLVPDGQEDLVSDFEGSG
jgi:DNA-binding MarR family transcriptional regulator